MAYALHLRKNENDRCKKKETSAKVACGCGNSVDVQIEFCSQPGIASCL